MGYLHCSNIFILTGWYSEFFDVPYLVNRIRRVFGEEMILNLSPWRRVEVNNKTIAGREMVGYNIIGVIQLDYIDLFKKFTLNTLGQQESYKLDHISSVVLGEKKLDYSEYGSLHLLYKHDYQKFVEYNVKDVKTKNHSASLHKIIPSIQFPNSFWQLLTKAVVTEINFSTKTHAHIICRGSTATVISSILSYPSI